MLPKRQKTVHQDPHRQVEPVDYIDKECVIQPFTNPSQPIPRGMKKHLKHIQNTNQRISSFMQKKEVTN